MLESLTNDALLIELHAAVGRTNLEEAKLLALIGEVDARRLFSHYAHASMFSFCVDELNLSEASAKKRITAAKCARSFPVLLEHVASGALHLCAITLLSPHLTPQNVDELVRLSLHASKRRIEVMLASRFGIDPSEPVSPGRLDPIGPDRNRLRATFTDAQRDKVEYAKALLSNRMPGATLEQVLDAALDALIAAEEKCVFGKKSESKSPAVESLPVIVAPSRRYVPSAIRHAVFVRDGYRCTYTAPDGRRCQSTHHLELDHVVPFGLGGEHSVTNLRIRCRCHNQAHAQATYGTALMQRWLR